eukprot:Opistho-2@36609
MQRNSDITNAQASTPTHAKAIHTQSIQCTRIHTHKTRCTQTHSRKQTHTHTHNNNHNNNNTKRIQKAHVATSGKYTALKLESTGKREGSAISQEDGTSWCWSCRRFRRDGKSSVPRGSPF